MTKKPLGFTLIEILITIAFALILSGAGFYAFLTFNKTTTLRTAYDSLSIALKEAKSSAVSQVKPSSCNSMTLTGYQVTLVTSTSPQRYRIEAVCTDSSSLQHLYSSGDKNLPSNITISSNQNPILFVLSGESGASQVSTIYISNGNQTETLTIDPSGLIQ